MTGNLYFNKENSENFFHLSSFSLMMSEIDEESFPSLLENIRTIPRELHSSQAIFKEIDRIIASDDYAVARDEELATDKRVVELLRQLDEANDNVYAYAMIDEESGAFLPFGGDEVGNSMTGEIKNPGCFIRIDHDPVMLNGVPCAVGMFIAPHKFFDERKRYMLHDSRAVMRLALFKEILRVARNLFYITNRGSLRISYPLVNNYASLISWESFDVRAFREEAEAILKDAQETLRSGAELPVLWDSPNGSTNGPYSKDDKERRAYYTENVAELKKLVGNLNHTSMTLINHYNNVTGASCHWNHGVFRRLREALDLSLVDPSRENLVSYYKVAMAHQDLPASRALINGKGKNAVPGLHQNDLQRAIEQDRRAVEGSYDDFFILAAMEGWDAESFECQPSTATTS